MPLRDFPGQKAGNVILDKNSGSFCKDGVSVAKEIELKEPYETWARWWKVASKTDAAGDEATTTATINTIYFLR
jgi:chaperonin GroEL (HSP60 family)